MKQGESKTINIGDGAAVIYECSNTETHKIPRLTIMTPFRLGDPDQKDEPSQSIILAGDAPRQLYEFLKCYFA